MRPSHGYFDEKPLDKTYDFGLLQRLWAYIKPYRLPLGASIILVMAITLLDLALPYVTKVAIDEYIVPQAEVLTSPSDRDPAAPAAVEDRLSTDKDEIARVRKDDLSGLGLLTLLFLVIIVINYGVTFTQRIIMEYAGHRIMHDLRMELFAHVQGLSVHFFTRNPVGRLVTRLTGDVQNMHELFTSVISMVFKDIFLMAGITVVLFTIHWKLALTTYCVTPIVIAITVIFSAKAREVFRLLRIKIAEINTLFAETIGGMRVVQLFVQEHNNYRKFKALNHENFEAGMMQIKIMGVFMPVIEFIGVCAVAMIIYYGGTWVQEGSLSLGSLVAFISYLRMLFRPIRDLAEKLNILQNAMASAERIFQLFDSDERLPATVTPAPQGRSAAGNGAHIHLDAVTFAYIANEPVLKNINISIPAGESLAVVGPTGSGKTTLINLIIRFYDPTSGVIRYNGRDIRSYPTTCYRNKMALVTQDPFLFAGTIRNNIFPNGNVVSEKKIEAVMDQSNWSTESLGDETILALWPTSGFWRYTLLTPAPPV